MELDSLAENHELTGANHARLALQRVRRSVESLGVALCHRLLHCIDPRRSLAEEELYEHAEAIGLAVLSHLLKVSERLLVDQPLLIVWRDRSRPVGAKDVVRLLG